MQWKAKKEATPAELAQMGQFVAALKAMGLLTDATLLRLLATKLPDFDVDAELEAMQAEAEAQALEVQRMAANAVVPADPANQGDQPNDQTQGAAQ